MTTYKIGDLVKVDERAAFRNDVQLDNFNNPQLNFGLINSYLFSSALPGGRQPTHSLSIAPAGVLENLVQTFLSDRLDNRFYLIATYGHGKSHLALALANYFSRPSASPEVSTLLEKLGNALGDSAKASRYADFKQSRGEFLVLRLRGDVPRSLHEQVLQGLEKALSEHTATKNEKLPFWFAEAERIIINFSPADKEKANQFLESAGYDIPSLLKRLGNREDVYDLCVRLIQHVSSIRPNLGGEVSLAQVIHWATDKFCGKGKPLGGLLILFDEFSLYVQKYAQRNATGELQDLLNGVSDRQGKAAFLAFSQIDLMQLADNLQIAGSTRVGLKRELKKKKKKWVLFSLMESVIDAYLIQDEQRWQTFLSNPQSRGPIHHATDIAWERFKKRYSTTLQWTLQHFQENVTKGCFPLHPITTYLLCNLRLQSDDAGTPRTVLGFVLEELRTRQDEPIVIENRLNWVQPISLVDYFEGRLSGDLYAQYNAARHTIGNDAPEEQAILKALLLQYLAEVRARPDEQIEFLAHTAGLEERVAKQTLRKLSDNHIIRYEQSYGGGYTFWAASNQPKLLQETIQKKLEQFEWSIDELNALNKTLLNSNFGSFEIKVDWGNSTDWAAREYIVTADLLSEWMQHMAAQFTYAYNHRDLIEPDRSSVLWVIASRDDEIVAVREQVSSEFQTTFAKLSENPPVLVAVVPQRAQPELLEAYRRKWALVKFTTKERADAGQEMYDAETKQADIALFRALRLIRSVDEYPAEIERPHTAYIVPTAYIGESRKSERVSLRELLIRLYRVAYAYTPTEFFTQYRVVSKGVNKLKDTTVKSSKVLISNAIADLKALARSDSMVRDLSEKFLIRKWEVLTADYRIKEQPGSRRVREAWQFIDNTIRADNAETKLREALFPLLNPPYGYDYNTALLLFSAWFGYHKLDLEVNVNGRRVQQQALIDLVGKGGPRDFFLAIATSDVVGLRRRAAPDKVAVKARIQAIGQNQFDLETANNEIVWLRETGKDERFDVDLRSSADQAAENLAHAVGQATQYNRDARQLKEQISRANSAKDLIGLQKKIGQLPTLGNIQVEADPPESLRQQIEERLTAVVEAFCRENEAPKKITDIGRNRDRLKEEKKAVTNVGLPHLIELIEQSLSRLDQREKELEAALQAEQREKNLLATINNVDPQGRLQQLRAGLAVLNELDNLPEKLSLQCAARLQQVQKAIDAILSQIAQCRHDSESVTQQAQLQPIRDKLLTLQPRCADTEEAEEIAVLLKQTEEIRSRLITQEQHHAALKQAILSVSEQASLLELNEGISQLPELPDLPADLAQLRDRQVRVLKKAIAAIHNQIEEAESDLESGQSTQQFKKVQEMLYALKTRCSAMPEAERVETLLARLETKREQLAQKEQHAANIRRVLDEADPTVPLKRLREVQQQIHNLQDVPPNLSKTRDQRLSELEQAINNIRAQIDRAGVDLAAAQSRSAINKTRDNLLKLQTRCANTPEEAEVNQLISQTDQLKAELEEQERRKSAWRETINSVNSNYHRLRQLLDGQVILQALTDLPDDLRRERDERLRNIEKAIQPIQQQVDRVQQSLDEVVNPVQLQKQRDELIKLRQRCGETPLEAVVNQHIDRADALQRFFEQIENERKPQIDSPGASHEQVKRLEQLEQGLSLSPSQRVLLTEQQEKVKTAARGQREKSQRWLAKQAQAFQNNEAIAGLVKQLDAPPATILAFLSQTEVQQLTTLRQQAQQRIDADALSAIENRFRQIQDRRLQEQCVQTLQRILDATQEGA